MHSTTSTTEESLRGGVRELLAGLGEDSWRRLDAQRRYPEEFVRAMTEAGHLGPLVPQEYDGMGLDLSTSCAANAAVQTLGGYGFDADYDVERKFRETRLFKVARISTNLVLSYVAERVLDLPRSF